MPSGWIGGMLASFVLLGGGLIAGCATNPQTTAPSSARPVAASPTPSVTPALATGLPDASPTSPGPTAPPTTPGPSGAPSALPTSSPVPAELPVRESAEYFGDGVRMTPGPAGGLYVSIPAEQGLVVVLLGATGKPRPSWPIALADTLCYPPAFAADGSIRVACALPDANTSRAYAFTSDGHPIAGWPVELPGLVWTAPQVVDGQLVVMVSGNPGPLWLVSVAPDGSVRTGAPAPSPQNWRAQLGPDGTGYLLALPPSAATADTKITAFDLNGVRPGWLVRVTGWVTELAFGPKGRLYVTEGQEGKRYSRILVFGPDGRSLSIGSDALPVAATNDYQGAGPIGGLAPPVVAGDGTSFFVSEDGGTTVYGLDPSGRVMAGWPYRDTIGLQWGYCAPGATGCAVWRSTPAVGPGDVLYLLHPPRDQTVGGSLVAIGPDGSVRPGWPVVLGRAGAEFRSVIVSPDGTAYAVVVEPEGGGRYSATLLAIAPNGTVRYRAVIVEP